MLGIRLHVFCSAKGVGELGLSLQGCRVELVEFLMNESSKEGLSHLGEHQSSYQLEHQTQLQLFNLILIYWHVYKNVQNMCSSVLYFSIYNRPISCFFGYMVLGQVPVQK